MVKSRIQQFGREEEYYSVQDLPRNKGVYHIKDRLDRSKYIGMTKNVRRRMFVHRNNGLYIEGEKIVFHPAPQGMSQDRLREHETRLIKWFDPQENDSEGGEGRRWKK